MTISDSSLHSGLVFGLCITTSLVAASLVNHTKQKLNTAKRLPKTPGGLLGMRVGPPSRRKRLHFVRHAEGYHNLYGEIDHDAYLREDLEDAKLTPTGEAQCRALVEKTTATGFGLSSQLLVVSPMNRTLQTAQQCFPSLINKIPWVAVEALREQSGSHPCDRRSTISTLSTQHPHVSFSEPKTGLVRVGGLGAGFQLGSCLSDTNNDVDPIYDVYGEEREPDAHVSARARLFLEWIALRPEEEILVVTHSAFLRHMMSEQTHMALLDAERLLPGTPMKKFENCEMRSYDVYFDS